MRSGTRMAVGARAAYGLFLLTMPERILAFGSARRQPSWAPGIVRVLGARHLLQAAVLAERPQLAGLGALVDLAHASTDIGCAALRSDLRVPALVDSGVATALALAGVSARG